MDGKRQIGFIWKSTEPAFRGPVIVTLYEILGWQLTCNAASKEIAQKISKTIQLTTPSAVREALEKAAPIKEVGFFALKSNQINKIEDLNRLRLLTCGDVTNDTVFNIVESSSESLKILLFSSSDGFTIWSNVGRPDDKIVGSESTKESFVIDGAKIDFKRTVYAFGGLNNKTIYDTILKKCVEEMRKDDKSVLLIKRSLMSKQGKEVRNDLVEIIFK